MLLRLFCFFCAFNYAQPALPKLWASKPHQQSCKASFVLSLGDQGPRGVVQGSSASLGKSGAGSKGSKGPGSKAKDPIQERKEAQLADEAQVCSPLLAAIMSISLSCIKRQRGLYAFYILSSICAVSATVSRPAVPNLASVWWSWPPYQPGSSPMKADLFFVHTLHSTIA